MFIDFVIWKSHKNDASSVSPIWDSFNSPDGHSFITDRVSGIVTFGHCDKCLLLSRVALLPNGEALLEIPKNALCKTLGLCDPLKVPRTCKWNPRLVVDKETLCKDREEALKFLRAFGGGAHSFQHRENNSSTIEVSSDLVTSTFTERLKCRNCFFSARIESFCLGKEAYYSLLIVRGDPSRSSKKTSCEVSSGKPKENFLPEDVRATIFEAHRGSYLSPPCKSRKDLVVGVYRKHNLALTTKQISNLIYREKCKETPVPLLSRIGMILDSTPQGDNLLSSISVLSERDASVNYDGALQDKFLAYLKKGSIPVSGENLLVFLSSEVLLSALPKPDELALNFSADYVWNINKAGDGLFVLTAKDVNNQLFPLGFTVCRGEKLLGYVFTFMALAFHYKKVHGSDIRCRYITCDGFASASVAKVIQDIFPGAQRKDCFFHACYNGRKHMKQNRFSLISSQIPALIQAVLPEQALRNLHGYFKKWGDHQYRDDVSNFTEWIQWKKTYLFGDKLARDGSLSNLSNHNVKCPPFTSRPPNVVLEGAHHGLRKVSQEKIVRTSDFPEVLQIVASTVIPFWNIQITAGKKPVFKRQFKADEAALTFKLNLIKRIDAEGFSFYIFKSGFKEPTKEWESFYKFLKPHGIEVIEVFDALLEKNDLLLRAENIDAGSKHQSTIVWSLFRAFSQHYTVSSIDLSGSLDTLKCSCRKFYVTSGCEHILRVSFEIGSSLVPSQFFFKLDPSSRLKRSQKRKRFSHQTLYPTCGIRAHQGNPLEDVPAVPHKLLLVPLSKKLEFLRNPYRTISQDLFETPVKNRKSNALVDKVAAEKLQTFTAPLPLPSESSPASQCLALRKCQDAGITIRNQAFADRIWKFHEMLQGLDVKYKVTRDVPGDGHCLYHAVIQRIQEQRPWMPSQLLTPEVMRGETVKALRRKDVQQEVFEFMRIEGKPGEEAFEKEYEAYVRDVSGSRWADHIMCTILSKLYGVLITVVDDNGCFSEINPQCELAPSLHILEAIVEANKGVVPHSVKAEVGNISLTHFVLIAKDALEEDTEFGKGKRRPKKKLKYGFDE